MAPNHQYFLTSNVFSSFLLNGKELLLLSHHRHFRHLPEMGPKIQKYAVELIVSSRLITTKYLSYPRLTIFQPQEKHKEIKRTTWE